MAFEHRDGTCTTCAGRIYRYPHPQRDHLDVWAHLDRADWIDNPHDPVPRQDATCQGCDGALAQHPTIADRWAHVNKDDVDDTHNAGPKVAAQ
jgi:hypothetical protein